MAAGYSDAIIPRIIAARGFEFVEDGKDGTLIVVFFFYFVVALFHLKIKNININI